MSRRIGLFMVMVCLAAGAGFSQAEVPADPGSPREVLTLDGAVAGALEKNHLLQAAAAAEGAALAQTEEARAMRLPRVELTEMAMRTTNPVYVFGNLLGQRAFGPANFAPSFLNEPPPFNNWNTKLSVNQPIWTGGKIKNGVAAAEQGQEAVRQDRERTRQQVVHQVVEAYTGAVLAQAHLKVAREALETAKAHVTLVKDLREAGLVVQSDLLQAQVRQSEMEEMVARAEAAVAVSRSALNLAMGEDLDTPQSFPDEIEIPALGDVQVTALTEEALSRRPDLKAAQARRTAADRMIQIARAGFLPEIGASGNWEANREDFIGRDGDNWSLILAARFTVFDGQATRARVRRAQHQKEQADQFTELLVQAVGLEVRQSYHQLKAASAALEQARQAAGQARESLRIVEDRYKEGLTTLVELLGAQTALTGAGTREVAAQREVLLAKAGLDLATGRL